MKSQIAYHLLSALIEMLEQSYFWTPEWQAAEKQADIERTSGEFRIFDSIDEMLLFLDKDS